MDAQGPTIKGIFINSHIKAVRNKKGSKGVQKLEELYGKSLMFRNADNIPIREEITIIEYALDILSEKPVPPQERTFEAGRLHFRNFTTTPLARIIFTLFKKNFKLMMMKTEHIAGHVFQGVEFLTEDLGETSVKITMKHNDYPIDHFRGLFYEWMCFSGHSGTIDAEETAPGVHVYVLRWQ